MMFRGDEPRVDRQPPLLDNEVVVSAAVAHASHLDDAEPTALGPVVKGELLQRDDAMDDALTSVTGSLAGT
jgi:hypothetical protein